MIARGMILEREHNERAWVVWHIAALPRMKRLPDLKKLQARRKRAIEPQSPNELLAMVRVLNAAFGGAVIEPTKD